VPDAGWQIVTVGDCNADGTDDIFWRNVDGRNYVWHLAPEIQPGGKVGLVSYGSLPTVSDPNWSIAGTGDFNGDGGRCDLLWRNAADGRNHVWHVDGARIENGALALLNFGALPSVPGEAWRIAAIADFDGDAQSDVFWRNPDGRGVIWYVNGSATSGGAIPLVPRDSLVPASVPLDAGVVRGDRVVSGLGPQ
jgi:hypothetical protein